MNFEMTATDVKLWNLNVRAEKNGSDEDRTAIDLTLIWVTANDALSLFHPGLARLVYGPETKQQSVDGVGPKTMRAFPSLGPLHWDEECTGLRVTVSPGINARSDLTLTECTADRFVIEPMDGGSVEIKFRVRSVCQDEHVVGKLAMLIKRDLPITIKRDLELRPGSVVDNVVASIERKTRRPPPITPEDAFMGT